DPNSSHCIGHIRPYSELATDLQNNTVARYNFIAPNVCDGLPDCSITTGDTWLSNNLPAILNSQAYQDNGAVFITWDEGANGSDGPIGDRKSTRLNSSHVAISYAVFCLKKKKK